MMVVCLGYGRSMWLVVVDGDDADDHEDQDNHGGGDEDDDYKIIQMHHQHTTIIPLSHTRRTCRLCTIRKHTDRQTIRH